MSNLVERIAKVSCKDGEYIVKTQQAVDDGDKETIWKCRADPHPDLVAAFQGLVPTVREICQFPAMWRDGKIVITGVSWSISETTDVEGACIVAQVELDTCNAPLNIVTPHLPYGQYNEEGPEQPVLSDEAIEALDRLRAEVRLYLDGTKRAQAAFNFRAAA